MDEPFDVKAAEPLPGDDFYLVSGTSICAWRDGKAVPLEGTELERVRRWVVECAFPSEQWEPVG